MTIRDVCKRVGENVFVIRLLDTLFPRRCPICDGILEPEWLRQKIHTECKERLFLIQEPVCMRCGRTLEHGMREYCYDCNRKQRNRSAAVITQGKALFLYRGLIKQTMYRFKYGNRREYAMFFAEYAMGRYGAWIAEKQIEAIVPVPMYRGKQRMRGYNQAEVFAEALSKLTGVPVERNLIERVVDTTPQKELNDQERKNNLKNAFQKGENIVQYSQLLIVDDIYTTGCTVEAVAEELLELKTKRIYFLSICIGGGM